MSSSETRERRGPDEENHTGTVSVIVAVVLLFSACAIAVVSRTISADIRSFCENGVRMPVRILGFRKVSSGKTPDTRTIAVAIGSEPGKRKLFASHVLMSDGEIARLSIGQLLRVATLPAESLFATLPQYDRYFVTLESLERHGRQSPSSWAIPSTLVFLALATIAAMAPAAMRRKKR